MSNIYDNKINMLVELTDERREYCEACDGRVECSDEFDDYSYTNHSAFYCDACCCSFHHQCRQMAVSDVGFGIIVCEICYDSDCEDKVSSNSDSKDDSIA